MRRGRSESDGRRSGRRRRTPGRRSRREPANEGRSVRPGRQPGGDLFDQAFPLPASLCESRAVVFGRQVRSQESHRREVDRARFEQPEDQWKPAGGPGDLDAVVGLVLGEREGVAAIGEERAVAGPKVDAACFELGQVGHQLRGRAALTSGKALQPGDEVGIGKPAQRREEAIVHAFF